MVLWVKASIPRGLGVLAAVLLLLAVVLVRAGPLGQSKIRAVHVPPEKSRLTLENLFVWPNSYYDVPRHRYPYYDKKGNGELVYGYGGRSLFRYSVFRPLEGYFRRK